MMNCSLYVKAQLSKLMQRLRRRDGGWALSAKGHQSIKHQVMRTLQVAKCDMSIIRQVVKCDMSPGGSAALRCDAIIAMSWSVGQRTRDKGEGERGALERREPELGGKHSQGEQVALDGLLTNDLNLSLTNQLAGRPTKLIV